MYWGSRMMAFLIGLSIGAIACLALRIRVETRRMAGMGSALIPSDEAPAMASAMFPGRHNRKVSVWIEVGLVMIADSLPFFFGHHEGMGDDVLMFPSCLGAVLLM